jgi:hypothetical protein
VDFTVVDDYLLGAATSKADALASLLRERSPDPAAAPFYRALDAVGVRAADEALIALRLVLAGMPPSDEAVRRLRALSVVARCAANGDERGLAAARKRDDAVLAGLPPADAPLAAVATAARAAYAGELAR